MTTFREFEQAGWSDNSTAHAYHEYVGQVTVGCIPDLLDAAGLKRGDKVLDVACGAGYVAAAAHDRGATRPASIFPRRRSGSQKRPIRKFDSSRATPKCCRLRTASSPQC